VRKIMRNTIRQIFSTIIVMSLLAMGCSSKKNGTTLLEELTAKKTGIQFRNAVVQSGDNNVLNYPYYFNGGGVSIGDINNDDLPDIYFTGNQVPNKLYLNKGNFEFEDITESAGVAAASGWKTGVTMTDVNQDGWLDIYVCRSAMGDSILRENLLFINNGNSTFTEKAKAFGIADNSYSTHASFFDYDKDGDLDLFVLNHSLPQYGGFSKLMGTLKNKKGSKFGSKLYQNTDGKFTDISEKAGIINNVLSFGLGLAVADLNQDGWSDLYISNDFNEEDYLYINNQDGTFKNVIRDATGHVSLFSMGSDVADINNDALPDIFTLDMMPETNERIKLSSGDDNYDKYQLLINAGFHHQSMRNMLQLNNGDGTFSEIGQLAGISNTDWSWASLFADFDGDGYKDLYVSNGYEKDYTNMQFLKFTVDEQMKARQRGSSPDLKLILDRMPSIQEGNFLFKNNGDLTFTKKTTDWGISRKFKSNGAAYADLDNDGDPDLVINAMNEPSVIYKNNSVENNHATFVTIDLRKQNPNQIITGTKIYAYQGDSTQYEEFSPVHGFQSCMYVPVNIGVHRTSFVDSVKIIWPDGKTQIVKNVPSQKVLAPRYEGAKESKAIKVTAKPLFTPAKVIEWKHTPADINDFKKQFMLPRLYSSSGPKMATGDVNKDGLQDVYICGPKDEAGALFLQQPDGTFSNKKIKAFEKDKSHQDEDAVFFDADNDHDLDLYVVSGGYGFDPKDPLLQDRLYLNNGSANFTRELNVLPADLLAGSCVEAIDVDGDKDIDLFVGSRVVPGQYPVAPASMFLVNDGKGKFTNEIKQVAPTLEYAGMVCDAQAADLNKDGKADLIVTGEWMPVMVMINTGRQLTDEKGRWFSTSTKGLWNCVIAEDFDLDGDPDLIAGNYGLNNQFHVTPGQPATLVYKDFNNDGQVDHFLCYYVNGKSYPYASRDEALGQVSFLKTRFPDYTTYANTTLETIFTTEELKGSMKLQADLLNTVYLENNGNGFAIRELPVQAQFSPAYAITAFDVDKDGDQDLVVGGNETNVRVRIGKSDANRGFVFVNDGKGKFSYSPQLLSGLNFVGDVRQLIFVPGKESTTLLVGETGRNITAYTVRK
jgi:hypothetical protein